MDLSGLSRLRGGRQGHIERALHAVAGAGVGSDLDGGGVDLSGYSSAVFMTSSLMARTCRVLGAQVIAHGVDATHGFGLKPCQALLALELGRCIG